MTTALQSMQKQIAAERETIKQQIHAPNTNTISTRGKVFNMPDGSEDEGPIEAIILDFINVNEYYTGAYDPTKLVPPSCFAISKFADKLVPSDNSNEQVHKTCAGCPNMEWGSAPVGKGKACKNTVRLALFPLDGESEKDILILKVSPTGLTGFNRYVNRVDQQGLLPFQVVTPIAMDPTKAYPTLKFPIKIGKSHDLMEKIFPLRIVALEMLKKEPEAE